MIFGHSRPAGIAWSITGSGASIDVDDPSDLADGRPDTVVPFTWASGTQNTSTVVGIRADWSDAIVPGIVGISNIDLPAGTKIQIAFRRESDTAGTYPYSAVGYVNQQRIIEGARGDRSAWLLFQNTSTPVVGCKVSIFNDVNGSPTIAASQEFHIGEIFIGSADDICVGLTASISRTDPTVNQFSWNSQPYTSPGVPYRQLSIRLQTAQESRWLDAYEPLIAKIDRGKVCAYVLSWTDANGNFSASKLHQYALIGIATTMPSSTHVVRAYYDSGPMTVVESPIPT